MSSVAPERQVARSVMSWLKLVLPDGSVVASIETEQRGRSASAYGRARFGLARKASGIVSGFPDAVAVLAAGRVVWFEWKRPDGGVLSLAQQGVHDRLRALGHQVIVATSIETARGGLRAAGVPLREDPAQLALAVTRVRRARPKLLALDAKVDLP